MKKKLIFVMIALSAYSFGFSQESDKLTVRYSLQPIVKMTLNNKSTWVLLDTGSSISVLDIKSKKKYGFKTVLRKDDRFSVPGFGSVNNQLHHVSNAELKFGDVDLRKKIYAYDISNIAESIQTRTGKRITAIIGTRMMKAYGFIIDVGNGTVAMSSKKTKKEKEQEHKSLIVKNAR